MNTDNSRVCPICRNTCLVVKQKFNNNQQEYSLIECPDCGIQYWNPLIHPSEKYYEEETLSIYKLFHEGRKKVTDPRFIKFLKDFKGISDKNILDVGCSDGLLLKELELAGNRVWGIDIDSISIEIARKRGLRNIFCSSVEDFVIKAKKNHLEFDVITVFDVLEHLTDPLSMLRELKTLLRKDGQIVITVPNRDRLLVNYIKTDFPPHHFWRFNTASLRNVCRNSGFSVDKLELFQYGYTNMVILDSAWKRLKKMLNAKNSSKTYNSTISSRNNKSVKKTVAAFVIRLFFPFSFLFEHSLQKGFKIYCVSSKE